MTTAHEFALYTPTVDYLIHKNAQQSIVLQDSDVVHRLVSVLRVEKGDVVIVFDNKQSVRCSVETVTKKQCFVTVLSSTEHVKSIPEIQWCVPLIAKEAFEDIVYNFTAMGVASIQPLITEKVKRSWGGDRERARLDRIMIAAAEQSKQFVFPQLYEPVALKNYSFLEQCVWFDPEGQSLYDTITYIKSQNVQNITCLVGPEGDFSSEEKEFLARQAPVIRTALTPTILKSETASAVAMGALRSCLR